MPKKAASKAASKAPAKEEEKVEEPKTAAEVTAPTPTAKAEEKTAPVEEPEEEAEEEAPDAHAYDLTRKITPFLDRHLILPILAFLEEVELYEKTGVIRASLEILKGTKMIDFQVDKYQALAEEVPEGVEQLREKVIAEMEEQKEKLLDLLHILEDSDQLQQMKKYDEIGEICTAFELDRDVFDRLLAYSKVQYDCGNYALSSELLKHYRNIMGNMAGPPSRGLMSSIWGSLASSILNTEFEEAAEVIMKLEDHLENAAKISKAELLTQRAWLLHWSLFPIFQTESLHPTSPVTKLLDNLLSEKSLSITSLACPHLLRYVSAALILHKRLKHLVSSTVWIIEHEALSYSDPMTRFLRALFIDIDFDKAQLELQRCAAVCKGDFFLARHWADIEENARLLIFETYCRIHQCINIEMISTKLNMEAPDAELWIVKLIQGAKLDARIDSEKGRVVMSKAPPSVYQQVIEKTKNLSFRSTMLLSNLEKLANEQAAGRGSM